jgi:hypothetical protein
MSRAAVVLLVGAAALIGASVAWTKQGARARLTQRLPLEAAAGTTIRVRWVVDVPNDNGGRTPFGAQEMFVRLLSRTGAPTTTAFTNTIAGSNAADVVVPSGGIGGVRVGLRGTTDILFPLVNDPFRSAGGVRCDVAALRGILGAFVRAYNAGDFRRLDRLFSRRNFVWYSAAAPGARLLAGATNRETLLPYFRRRHRHADELALVAYRFNDYERRRELGHFELTVRRRAADFRDRSWFEVAAKGALDCSKPPLTISALSIGGVRG